MVALNEITSATKPGGKCRGGGISAKSVDLFPTFLGRTLRSSSAAGIQKSAVSLCRCVSSPDLKLSLYFSPVTPWITCLRGIAKGGLRSAGRTSAASAPEAEQPPLGSDFPTPAICLRQPSPHRIAALGCCVFHIMPPPHCARVYTPASYTPALCVDDNGCTNAPPPPLPGPPAPCG